MYIEQFSLRSIAYIRKKIYDSSIPKSCKKLSSVGQLDHRTAILSHPTFSGCFPPIGPNLHDLLGTF
ncbi:hypothetical protein ACN38_g8305 [Penicillium nordicum]|uniref:Uncharacterized protein n=1 Tax=Penicillium nordicum TaxID=229535 RepID=A0A0M8NWJ9_9EURO|nr:hypothetical protein ACN38_g8305 [Penicillium nordicum]